MHYIPLTHIVPKLQFIYLELYKHFRMAFHMTRPEQETLRRMLQNQATLEEKFNHDVIIMHIIPNGSINYYSKNQEVVNWLNENVQHIFSLFQTGNNNIRQPQDAMQPGEEIVNQPILPTWPARNLNDISIDYLTEFLRQICRKLLGLDKKSNSDSEFISQRSS